jgi:hypothetical protein
MADYLYNGVEAPAIPDSLKNEPYMCLTQGHNLAVFSEEPTIEIGYGDDANPNSGEAYGLVTYTGTLEIYSNKGTYWSYLLQYSAGTIGVLGIPVWANFDFKNKDGSLFLAASDPVPVSPVKLNPALLVQSFFVGDAIKRMRGVQPVPVYE